MHTIAVSVAAGADTIDVDPDNNDDSINVDIPRLTDLALALGEVTPVGQDRLDVALRVENGGPDDVSGAELSLAFDVESTVSAVGQPPLDACLQAAGEAVTDGAVIACDLGRAIAAGDVVALSFAIIGRTGTGDVSLAASVQPTGIEIDPEPGNDAFDELLGTVAGGCACVRPPPSPAAVAVTGGALALGALPFLGRRRRRCLAMSSG